MAANARNIRLTNSDGRDAVVSFTRPKRHRGPRLGMPNAETKLRRYVVATAETLHGKMAEAHGEDYGQALIDGDPEVEFEALGRSIQGVHRIYLSHEGDILHAPPKWVEVIFAPDGTEKQRREPEDRAANIAGETPVRWTGKKLKKADAIRRFVFGRTLELGHTDGLSYDYLYAMAKELQDEDVLVMLGAGEKGKEPLVLQSNGTPYRGFLEGQVEDGRYRLLVHLSNMELKRPEEQK